MMKPITRKEKILDAILSGNTDNIPTPITREETYLKLIAENGSGGGGESTGIWKPSVSEEGVISWEKSTSTVTPEEQNIKGPKGDTGAQGETGATGETGPAGPGLASGGVAGSLLFKSSNDDYATEWVDSGIATVEGNPATAETDSAGIGVKTVVDIEPQQDLHGYDSPWVGGAGKNKLPMTVEGIKAANTGGTWSGNSYTKNNVVFTLNTDRDGNITSIMVNGTNSSSTDSIYFKLAFDITTILFDGTYTVSGCIGGTSGPYSLQIYASGGSAGNNVVGNFDGDTSIFKDGLQSYYVSNVYITIRPNATMSNVLFYPMIRLATETDPTFAPYSNICPISGWTACNVTRSGKNLWDEEWEVGTISTNTGANTTDSTRIRSKHYIPVIPNTDYYLRCSVNDGRLAYYDANQNFISIGADGFIGTHIFRTIPNARYIRFSPIASYGTTYNHDISINYPATFTEYEPYTDQSVTVQLGQTVYGGTLDVTNGVLTVDRGFITFDGSEDEIMSIYEPGEYFTLDYANFGDLAPKRDIDGIPTNRISPSATRMGNLAFVLYWRGLPSDVRTVAALRTWLASNNLQVCYELATPYTLSLSPHQIKLLQGVNNLSTNAHSVTLTYRKGKVAMNSDLEGLADSVNVLVDEVDSFGIKPLTATALSDAVTISTFSAMKINKNVIFSCRVVITPTEEGSMPLFAINGVECPFYHTGTGRNNARGIDGRWSIDKDTNIVMWTVVSTELDKANDIMIQGVLAVK